MTIVTLAYPFWKRAQYHISSLRSILVYFVFSYWVYEAYYRIANSIADNGHCYVPIRYAVDPYTAAWLAIPFIIVGVAILIHELFLNPEYEETERIVYVPVWMPSSQKDREALAEDIRDRKSEGALLVGHSPDGAHRAKKQAKALGIHECFIGFEDEKSVIRQF